MLQSDKWGAPKWVRPGSSPGVQYRRICIKEAEQAQYLIGFLAKGPKANGHSTKVSLYRDFREENVVRPRKAPFVKS